MIRRYLSCLPLIALLAVAAVIVLAARAPRTWATHWTEPHAVATAAGEAEYGAVRDPGGGWDLLWVDDNSQKLQYTRAAKNGREYPPIAVDSGDVLQPTLLRAGSREIGAWIRNDNGRTIVMAAILRPASERRVVQLISSPSPLEHPYLFVGPGGRVELAFSWQRYGNFDLYLAPLSGTGRLGPIHRLTRAAYYSFYPRAVADASRSIDVIHLESCCHQHTWQVMYDRYDAAGRRQGPGRVLSSIQSFSNGDIPGQWAEDIQIDHSGHIWGAFAGDDGVYVFEAAPSGTILRPPALIDAEGGRPPSLSLVLDGGRGYVAWEQPYDLGAYVDTRSFDLRTGMMSGVERAVYASGSQTEPHTFTGKAGPIVMWQLVSKGLGSTFETAQYRVSGAPTLAQRLGLGLGNPWEDMLILVLGSIGLAALATTVNILWVMALALLGLFVLRLFRWLPSKWIVYACVLACALYLVFVSPGGPILFLATMSGIGLATVPFGILAFGGALASVSWVGAVQLRRVDDLYRAGIMAFVGIFFFAYIEGIVFVQQQLGYI